MKYKKIMLIALVLLAVLTIGAVSATEDIASDDGLAASDDVTVIADGDDNDLDPVDDETGEGDGNEEEEEYNPIYIYDEAYVNSTIGSVYLDYNASGRIVVNDENNEYLNETLSDWNIDDRSNDGEGYYYYINSARFNPPLEADNYELTVTYFDDDDNQVYTNTGEIELVNRAIYELDDGVVIEIAALPVSLQRNDALVSIRALRNATDLVCILLVGNEDSFPFEKILDGLDYINVTGSDYCWFKIMPSDFEGIHGGNYSLELRFYPNDGSSFEHNATVTVVNEDEDEETGEGEGESEGGDDEDYYIWFKRSSYIGDEDDIIYIEGRKGTYNVTVVDADGNEYEVSENLKEYELFLSLDDLKIKDMGKYQLSLKYISDEGNVTDLASAENLTVTELTYSDEIDANDPDALVFSVYNLEGLGNKIVIYCYDDEEHEDTYSSNTTVLSDYPVNTLINFTASDLGLSNKRDWYDINVYILSEDDYIMRANRIAAFEINVIDYTKFRFEALMFVNQLSNVPVVSVYCPEGSEGTVNLTIYKENGNGTSVLFKTAQKNILEKDDENWLSWTLDELEMDVGNYEIRAAAGDEEFEPAYTNVNGAIEISESAYLENDDADRINMVYLYIPMYYENGTIAVKINGTEVFNHDLSDFEEREHDGEYDYDKLYWFEQEHRGPGEDMKEYRINVFNIGCELKEGVANVEAILSLEGKNPISADGNITLAKPNSASENNYTIEIYDNEEYFARDSDVSVIRVTAPEGDKDYYVIVTRADDEEYRIDSRDFYGEEDEESFDGSIYPYQLRLDAGEYPIIVTVFNGDDEQMVNNTATITLTYGEEGIMCSEVHREMDLDDEWGIQVEFYTLNVSGNLTIKADGETYFDKHINNDNLTDEWGNWLFRCSPRDIGIEPGHYDLVEIIYQDDSGISDGDTFDNIEVLAPRPNIYIRYSDWDSRKAQYTLDRDDLIGVHIAEDDVSTIRITVKIGDETVLDAMLEDLGLTPDSDEDGVYYNIGFNNFNKTFELGEHYDNVVAYYHSDSFDLDTVEAGEEGENPNFFDVIGIVKEIDVNGDSDVLYVIGDESKEYIGITVYDSDWNPISVDPYYIQEGDDGKFITWTLADLGLGVGDYRIEAYYNDNDDYWIFDDDFKVVDKSKFFATMECDWLYTTDAVIKVWCPEGLNGTIKIIDRDEKGINEITHSITDDEKGTYVGFTLADLNITRSDWYGITINVNGENLTGEEDGLWVPGPIYMPGFNVFVPEEGFEADESMMLARIELPADAAGTVTITIDGKEYFMKDLENIESYSVGPKTVYEIFTTDLKDSVELGKHAVVVSFSDLKDSRLLNFNKRNATTKDYVTVIVLNGEYGFDWGDLIAEIIAPRGLEGRVDAYLNGTRVADWDEISWINWKEYDEYNFVYYIYQQDFNRDEYGVGIYDLTVTFDNYISATGTVVFMGDETDDVFIWDEQSESLGFDDVWFHIHTNGPKGIVVVTANGEMVLNKTLDELTYVEDWDEYVITPANTTVAAGHYDSVVAVMYCSDYSFNSFISENGATIGGQLSDVEFTNDIEFDYGSSGTTNITLIGASDVETTVLDGEGEVVSDVNVTVANNVITVSGLNASSYTLVVTTVPEEGYFANNRTARITVNKASTSISIVNTTLTMNVGDEVDPGVSLVPAGAGELDYRSSDVSVVVVNGDGTFTAVADGSAIVTVSFYGNDNYEAAESKNITVAVNRIATEITVKNATLVMNIGDEVDPGVSLVPVDAGELDYRSSDVSVVTVDGDGTFVAVGDGTAIVTILFGGNDKYAAAENKTVAVTVNKIATSIALDKTTLELEVGANGTIVATTTPAGLVVTYTSSNPAVATVNNGVVTAVADGSAVITVSYAGNATYAAAENKTVAVTVNKIATSIALDKTTLELKVGANGTIVATTTPAGLVVTYTSSNPAVATVNNGVVTAVSEGSAVITVSYAGDATYAAAENKTVAVGVGKIPTVITVNPTTLDLNVGGNATIAVTTTPEGLEVIYTSSNPAVATVNNGVVTAVADGSAVITVSYAGDATYAAAENKTVTVNVAKIPTAITVDTTSLDLNVGDNATIVATIAPEGLVVTYTSSNPAVAAVNNGVVSAVAPGSAIITVSYAGDATYAAAENKTVAVTVAKIAPAPGDNTTIPVDNANTTNTKVPVYTIDLPDDAIGNFTVIIDKKPYKTVEVVKGKASISVPGLAAGNHEVTLTYSGDAKYAPIVKNTTSTVIVDPVVVPGKSAVLYTDKYSVIVKGKDGKVASGVKVAFYISGKYIAKAWTDKNGVASFNIPYTIKPGKVFKIRATSALGASAVKKVAYKPILYLKAVKIKKSTKKLVLTAAFKKVNGKYYVGKKVLFRFAGFKFYGKITKKGVAQVVVSKKALNFAKTKKSVKYSATFLKDTAKRTAKVK